MNWIDLIILIPIIWLGWRGFRKGLIIEIFTLLALLVGLYIGINFSDFAADILRTKVGFTSDYVPVIAFTITFLCVGAIVYFAGVMIEKAVNLVAMKMVNKVLGMVLGIIKALFFISVIIVIIEAYDKQSPFFSEKYKKESLLYRPIKQISLTTIPALRYSDLFMDMTMVDDSEEEKEKQNTIFPDSSETILP